MAKKEFNANIKCKSNLKSFIKIVANNSDGSVYFVLKRNGAASSYWKYDSRGNSAFFDKISRKKTKKISYHTSGKVNFHNLDIGVLYCEPLVDLKNKNPVFIYSIPSISKLDNASKDSDRDINLDDHDEDARISFLISVLPFSLKKESGLYFVVNDLFLIEFELIKFDDYPHPDCFVIARPENLIDRQKLNKHDSLIIFHQQKTGFKGTIVYEPNDKGEFKLIYGVTKAKKPKIIIIFEDPNLSAHFLSATESNSIFKIKDKNGNFISKNVKINSIEIDAEF